MPERLRRACAAAAACSGIALAAAGAAAGQLSDTFTNFLDHPAIEYHARPADDVVARLGRKVADGTIRLTADGPSGYLRSVLDALGVSVQSQVAVFAKDSVQAVRIGAANPRALYFNDEVAVGWVRGGFIELAAQDARQGGVNFYVLDAASPDPPRFMRQDSCLSCHYSYSTSGVPGMLARSAGQFSVNHTIPLEQRWGGWYVTGDTGSIRHLGNAEAEPPLETTARASNWPSFEGRFDTTGYLSTRSDVVALLVFEHQMHMMNLLARLGWEARVGQYVAPRQAPAAADDFDAPVAMADAAREVVDYLLFVDEAPLNGPIAGSSGFVEAFAAKGPADSRGRSLRQLDLHHRLMRYPCSYMIYAPVFDQLPRAARDAVYARLWRVLSGAERDAKYARLTADDRRAVIEILLDTKPDLPAYFHVPAS